MTDDKPTAQEEKAEGREVFVTKDETGITALAEDEDAADPRVTTDAGSRGEDDKDDESSG